MWNSSLGVERCVRVCVCVFFFKCRQVWLILLCINEFMMNRGDGGAQVCPGGGGARRRERDWRMMEMKKGRSAKLIGQWPRPPSCTSTSTSRDPFLIAVCFISSVPLCFFSLSMWMEGCFPLPPAHLVPRSVHFVLDFGVSSRCFVALRLFFGFFFLFFTSSSSCWKFQDQVLLDPLHIFSKL